MEPFHIKFFFNFRSPYCYLISKSVFSLVDDFNVAFDWYPLGGWDGRSPPERAKTKLPIARADVARWCAQMGIPMNPPPITTDPSRAGAASLYAQAQGQLRPYLVEAMRVEWAFGKDIGQDDALTEIAERAGLDAQAVLAAADNPEHHAALTKNAEIAAEVGVIGVPSIVIDEEVFWGNDRLHFVRDELMARRLRKV